MHEVASLLDAIDRPISSEPALARAAVLWVYLTMAAGVFALGSYFLLGVVDSMCQRALQHNARALQLRQAESAARAYVRISGFVDALRRATGVHLGYGRDQPSTNVKAFFSRRKRFGSFVLFVLFSIPPLTIVIARVALRLTVANLLIWLLISWRVGWLDAASAWATGFDWPALQPSQIAAVLGLVVVAWAVVVRSDIRGRIEWNKTASLEARKRLALIRLRVTVVLAELAEVNDEVVGHLDRYPGQGQLTQLTGFHGLRWSEGGLSVLDHECRAHRDVLQPARFQRPTRHNLLGQRGQTDQKTSDDVVATAVADIRSQLDELRELGYSAKLREIVSPAAWSALIEIRYGRVLRHADRTQADGFVTRTLDLSDASSVQWAWKQASSTTGLENAVAVAEHEVRYRVCEVRDFLWDSYVIAAHLEGLVATIDRMRRERLVDRLKQ